MSYRSLQYKKHHLTPLTEENLDKMNLVKETTHDPLLIYSSMNYPRIQTPPHPSSLKRPKRRSTDTVVESPRLLPFPYHNDGQFLPTVERNQHHYQKKRSAGGSLSDLSLHSKRTSISHCPQRAYSVPPPIRSPIMEDDQQRPRYRHSVEPVPSTTCSSTTCSSSSSSSSSSFYKLESFFVRLVGTIKNKRNLSRLHR
ncbi:hypothetical protein BC941DRAFT_516775 [Chlamydoabsidia padenii]|nr:hypothetical protein BC941DRAFT_516775 [Chlamydoabsidia padenii]